MGGKGEGRKGEGRGGRYQPHLSHSALFCVSFFGFAISSGANERVLLLQSCFSDHKKASSLEAYVDWFNRLSYLVATEICLVRDTRRAEGTMSTTLHVKTKAFS